MAKGRIEFPASPVLTAATQLEARFAQRIPGGSKSGLAVVNVLRWGSGFTTPLVRIYSACDLAFDPNMGTSASYWFNANATATITGTGTYTISLSAMSEWVRWAFEAGGAGSIAFTVTIHPFDS